MKASFATYGFYLWGKDANIQKKINIHAEMLKYMEKRLMKQK